MYELEIKEISINHSARNTILIALENAASAYLDFTNNYISKEKFAVEGYAILAEKLRN